MGEMADFALEQLADRIWSERLQRYYDGFDNIMVEEEGLGGIYGPGHKKSVTCKYCGEKGLYWSKHETGWRLFKGDALHLCKEYNGE